MESKNKTNISIDIPNYTGPLETLLDLAKNQKVDLTKISVTKLADQFLEYIKKFKNKNLDLAFEYLLMATWLTYLKSKLLLHALRSPWIRSLFMICSGQKPDNKVPSVPVVEAYNLQWSPVILSTRITWLDIE